MGFKEGKEENTEGFRSGSTAGEVGLDAVNLKNSFGLRGEDLLRSSDVFFDNRIAREPRVSLENVRWLTTSEAAQYLRVSISSIKTMIYRGQVRVHKLGRRNRFLKDELERLITLPISK